jgi:hypothetical protein
MTVFAFILGLVVLGPIAKAIAERITRSGATPAGQNELKKSLQATEQRLAETETRLGAVEERLDFYEKLLSNPTRPSTREIPPRSP